MMKNIGNTPMIKLEYQYKEKTNFIYAKLEYYNLTGSIKDRVAYYMIQNAKNMMGILKEFTKNNSKGIEEANATIVNTKKEIAPNQKKEVVSTTPTSPTFFL